MCDSLTRPSPTLPGPHYFYDYYYAHILPFAGVATLLKQHGMPLINYLISVYEDVVRTMLLPLLLYGLTLCALCSGLLLLRAKRCDCYLVLSAHPHATFCTVVSFFLDCRLEDSKQTTSQPTNLSERYIICRCSVCVLSFHVRDAVLSFVLYANKKGTN